METKTVRRDACQPRIWEKDSHDTTDHGGRALSQRSPGRWKEARDKEFLRNRCYFMHWGEGKSLSAHVQAAIRCPACSDHWCFKTYLLEHLGFLEASCIRTGILLDAYSMFSMLDWVPWVLLIPAIAPEKQKHKQVTIGMGSCWDKMLFESERQFLLSTLACHVLHLTKLSNLFALPSLLAFFSLGDFWKMVWLLNVTNPSKIANPHPLKIWQNINMLHSWWIFSWL